MNAFRLETISPATGHRHRMSARDRLLEKIREEAFGAGFVAGQADATESHLEDQARLTSELVEAVHDARVTNEAARSHVTASLGEVVRALIDAIAPALAQAGMAGEVARLVGEALDAAPEARPRIRCAPELLPVLRELFASREHQVIVEEAPELLPREARIHWDQGYDRLDLDACIAQIRACLASHTEQATGSENDGERRYG